MNRITLTIPGKPLGKQRPRVLKNGITYTPKETVDYETFIKELYVMRHFHKQFQGPLKLTITAYFPIPSSASKKKKELMLAGIIRPTIKPDWDNIGKIVTDALNHLAYDDDKQIVEAIVRKFYSDEPRVEIEIEEVST
ncbi:RusA family crossover junction endodeoxyribonuclease [Caldanaerobacter sp.]|uniref:RusA family crossover junction endodeoxyribonuclease n=1 Tax=Caldanaerobacter sp. TaxID=2930036 RepID=UPI003C792180